MQEVMCFETGRLVTGLFAGIAGVAVGAIAAALLLFRRRPGREESH